MAQRQTTPAVSDWVPVTGKEPNDWVSSDTPAGKALGAPPDSQTAGQTAKDLSAEFLMGPLKAIAGLPDAVQEVIKTAMSKDPQQAVDLFVNAVKSFGTAPTTMLRNVSSLAQAQNPQLAPFMAVKTVVPPSMQENREAANFGGATTAMAALGAAAEKFPREARAQGKFNAIEAKGGQIPVEMAGADATTPRYGQFKATGDTPVKVVEDFLKRREDGSPIPYSEARLFASKAGELTQEEIKLSSNRMKAQVTKFAEALKDANREAAAKVGMEKIYDEAINEYRRAKNIQGKVQVVTKHLEKHGLTYALGGAMYALFRDINK